MAKDRNKAQTKRWKNRIVGHAEVHPRTVKEHPDNYKIHSLSQSDALGVMIGKVGFLRSVTINKRTGHLVDGHLRVALALKTGQTSIPVEYVDLSAKEELQVLASIDPLVMMAGGDASKIDELVAKLGQDDDAAALLKRMAAPVSPAPEDEAPETTTINFKKGTTVKIGPHRFQVPKRKFSKWIEALKLKHGEDEAAVIAELKKRLGLDVAPTGE